MTVTSVQVTLNESGLRALYGTPSSPLAKDMLRRAKNVESEAKRRCPVDTGRLRSSINGRVEFEGGFPVGLVGTVVKYGIFQEEGTGVFGPTGQRIVPVNASVLRWENASGVHFARSVSGVKGRHFLRDSLSAAAK